MNKKIIILTITSIFLIIGIFITSILLINSLPQKINEDQSIYGVVLENYQDHIKIKDLDDNILIIDSKSNPKLGDFILVHYNLDNKDNEIEVIASNDIIEIKTTKTTITSNITTTTSSSSKVNNITNKSKSTTTIKSTTTKTTTTELVNDEDIINYAKDTYNLTESSNSLSKNIKSSFVTLVDFIFYNGTIKGKTFNELKNTTKAKVIYYTLLIDNKIDSKWPDYKTEIKNKYTDIKAKLIAKYMDITANVCENNSYECEVTRNDFNTLKTSLNLTWNFISSSFKYAFNSSKDALKNWYEVWRNK